MAAALSFLLTSALLSAFVNAQAYDAGERSEDAFSYVQPLNTTILGPYGHSPAVLPSRKPASILRFRYVFVLIHVQQMRQAQVAGRVRSPEHRFLWLNSRFKKRLTWLLGNPDRKCLTNFS